MKKFLIFLIASQAFACDKITKELGDDNHYEIVCKHPNGEVMTYIINSGNQVRPYRYRSGVFDFYTIDGTNIIATDCFTNNIPIKKED